MGTGTIDGVYVTITEEAEKKTPEDFSVVCCLDNFILCLLRKYVKK